MSKSRNKTSNNSEWRLANVYETKDNINSVVYAGLNFPVEDNPGEKSFREVSFETHRASH